MFFQQKFFFKTPPTWVCVTQVQTCQSFEVKMSSHQPMKTGLFCAFKLGKNKYLQTTTNPNCFSRVLHSLFLNASWLAIHNNSGNFWTQLKNKLRIKLALNKGDVMVWWSMHPLSIQEARCLKLAAILQKKIFLRIPNFT